MTQASITERMEQFRLRSRMVWELTLSDYAVSLEQVEPFLDFRRFLFDLIVAYDLPVRAGLDEHAPFRSTIGLSEGDVRVYSRGAGLLPVMLNKVAGQPSGSWREDEVEIDTLKTEVGLLDVFDWDHLGGMRHEYYLVKILASSVDPSLIGLFGLVRPQRCEFRLTIEPDRT